MFMLRYIVKVKFNRTKTEEIFQIVLILTQYIHVSSWKCSKSFEVDLRVIHITEEQKKT